MTPERSSWRSMKDRCTNPRHPYFSRYGGRGIKVCDAWQSLDQFVADMGQRPFGCEIDRIDNDGDYEPSNCRWATRTEQIRNRSITRRVDALGQSLTLTEWCERTGLKYTALKMRLRSGWDPVRAVTTPPIPRRSAS